MKKTVFFVLSLLLVMTLSTSSRAETPETAQIALIKNFYATLVDTMKQGDKLGFEGREKKLDPEIRKTFNLPLMARTAVGLTWSKEPEDEKEKLIEAFSAFSVATYASRFTHYDGERFEVLGERAAAQGGSIVETKLTPKDGDPVTLNYLVRPNEKGEPRVVDVYLDATISELATRRSEFTTLIRREGFPALIVSLEAKTKKMAN